MAHKIKRKIVMGLVLAALTVTARVGNAEKEQAALAAASWLNAIDAGQYADSWQTAAVVVGKMTHAVQAFIDVLFRRPIC